MHLILGFVTLASLAVVHGQQSEKATSIGRSSDRFFLADKRSGSVTPGLIPFPRIGRSGIHEGKRQLIPFPRVGRSGSFSRWQNPYFFEYEDVQQYPADANSLLSSLGDSSNNGLEDNDQEKRNGSPNGGQGMWFGPRLGRRKRSITETESSVSVERTHGDNIDPALLVKILHNFNWAIVPLKN